MSSNADSPNLTDEDVIAQFGVSAQKLAETIVIACARAPKLVAEEAELAADRAAVKAFGDQDAINAGSDTRKIQDLADAVNKAAAQAVHVHSLTASRDAALAFAKGKPLGEVRGSFGPVFGDLMNNDLVVEDFLRDALVAAL